MTFKERYRSYNDDIRPVSALICELEKAAREQSIMLKREIFRAIRGTVAATAVVLCFCFVMPVLAMTVTPIYQMMYQVSPELAQFFRPVQMADEYRGIRMEVVSAYIHENEAQVYVTLQDLEGDRIDASTDLYDSYHINTPFSCVGSCSRIGYNPETKKATFLITISQMEGQKIEGEKITFSVSEFISHKECNEDLIIPISLSDAEEQPDTMAAVLRGLGATEGFQVTYEIKEGYEDLRNHTTRVLVPQPDNGMIPMDGIEFTGMGYVNGMLHIQYAVPDLLLNDNHGYFFLVDEAGQERRYDCAMSFWGQDEATSHISYEDCVFDLSPEELSGYTLHGYFVTTGFRMDGDWSVTFPLEQEEE